MNVKDLTLGKVLVLGIPLGLGNRAKGQLRTREMNLSTQAYNNRVNMSEVIEYVL